MEYNKTHGVKPITIKKDIKNSLNIKLENSTNKLSKQEAIKRIDELRVLMDQAASKLDFETAIKLRDEINKLSKSVKTKK